MKPQTWENLRCTGFFVFCLGGLLGAAALCAHFFPRRARWDEWGGQVDRLDDGSGWTMRLETDGLNHRLILSENLGARQEVYTWQDDPPERSRP